MTKKYTCKADYFDLNGFDESGYTYIVLGDDTYSIKDSLKAQGCVYSRLYGWHKATPSELPPSYKNLKVLYSDYQEWDPIRKYMYDLEDAYDKLAALKESSYNPTPSNFLKAEVGSRVHNIPVTCRSVQGFNGMYGYTRVISFLQKNDNVLVWMTTSSCPVEENAHYYLTGTIKKFQTYHGENQTHLSRVTLKENNDYDD